MIERLKARSRALDPHRALKLLQETCAASGWRIERVLHHRIVKERPGRRMVVRYDVEVSAPRDAAGRQMLYGKLYRGHGGERFRAAWTDLHARLPAGLCFPDLLGYHERRRFLLLRALAGAPLEDLLATHRAARALEAFGRALAGLHALHPSSSQATGAVAPRWRHHDARAEGEVLEQAQERFERASHIAPDLKRRFAHQRARVVQTLTAAPGSPAGDGARDPDEDIIHRDLYPGQVVVLPGGCGLIDLDELCLGEGELDVGNFIAHLMLADLQQSGEVGTAGTRGESFLSGYRQVRPIRDDRRRLYTAASLLRLATLERLAHPVVSVLSWPRLADALLQTSGALLEDGS